MIKRVNYSFLDLLSDIGGLNRALISLIEVALLVLGFLGATKMDNFLSESLYNIDDSSEAND